MKQSIVPMLGWIMPEPLAIAPIFASLPPTVKEMAISFFTVSVVMMALAAAAEPPARKADATAGIPASIAAMLMV